MNRTARLLLALLGVGLWLGLSVGTGYSQPPPPATKSSPLVPPGVFPTPSQAGASSVAVTLTAVADTFVASSQPGSNYGNINWGMWVGHESYLGIERGVLLFDLSVIPMGSVVQRATLYVALGNQTGNAPAAVTAYRVTKGWAEYTATWSTVGDAYGNAYDVTTVGTELAWYPFDLTELVQEWLWWQYPNYGVMLRGLETGAPNDKGFLTKENGADYAPRLVIEYVADTTPPVSSVQPLPLYSKSPFAVTWTGWDAGGAGLFTGPYTWGPYDIWYRDGSGGQWAYWLRNTSSAPASFTGTAGHIYYFQSQAWDRALNHEGTPSGDGDAHTTVVNRLLSGTISTNRGQPLMAVNISVQPAPPGPDRPISNPDGTYLVGVLEDGLYTITVTKTGLMAQTMRNVSVSADVAGLNFYLWGGQNLATNGDFETGDVAGWTTSGAIPPVATANAHTGNYSAMLGQSAGTELGGDSLLRQSLTVASGLRSPTLSFLYQYVSSDTTGGDWFEVTISDTITSTLVLSTSTAVGWTHRWVDLGPWSGKAITLSFKVHQMANNKPTEVRLDEVSVAAALEPTKKIYLPLLLNSSPGGW